MYIVHIYIYMNISYAMSAPLIPFSWFCSLFSVSTEVKFSILDSCLSYLPKLIVLWSGHASRVILSPIYLPLNCLELLASEFNFPAWFMSSHKYHAHTHPKEAPATPSLSHFPFAPYYPSQAALGAAVGCADRTPCLKDDVGASTALPLLISTVLHHLLLMCVLVLGLEALLARKSCCWGMGVSP